MTTTPDTPNPADRRADPVAYYTARYQEQLTLMARFCTGVEVANQGSTCYAIFGTLPSTLTISVANDHMQDASDDDGPFSMQIYTADGELLAMILDGTLEEQLRVVATLLPGHADQIRSGHLPETTPALTPLG